MLRSLPILLMLAAAPAAAQIVVVPLDPVEGQDTIPLDPVNPDEVVPLDPVNPGEVVPLDPLVEGDQQFQDLFAPPPPGSVVGDEVTTVEEDTVATGTGAVLKGLDKLAGTVEDIRLATGETAALGWLQITLGECRYPIDNPTGDAYAWLVIREDSGEAPIFEGWMIASSPALNALDHSRFDVWVINCTTE